VADGHSRCHRLIFSLGGFPKRKICLDGVAGKRHSGREGETNRGFRFPLWAMGLGGGFWGWVFEMGFWEVKKWGGRK
jgi:hypothetical protein